MKRYFITGTDTDCGKSYVTSKLLQYVQNSMAIKPISSGGLEDARLLQGHNPIALDLERINPWRFKRPIAPHLAARQEGKALSVAQLSEYCLQINWPGIDHLFIEGAGGVMVPLNQGETWLDFLRVCQIPVIIVVGLKLGCLNHALLTEYALQSHDIQCLGWIANCLNPTMECLEENIETLKEKLNCPLLSILRFSKSIENLDLF